MKIIVDAMGGDNAPFEIVKGSLRASRELGPDIVLTGREVEIGACLKQLGCDGLPEHVSVVNATEVIDMEDEPSLAYRRKPDSSMTVGLNLLKNGEGDALVSAGSTGALLSGATLVVKRIRGVRRAALAPLLPTKTGQVMVIDVGANVECATEHLVQFALLGSGYMKGVMNVESPRVGLLNNGTEETKGAPLQVETYPLLKELDAQGKIRFIGNVEAKDVMQGVCDVVVCDGYSGNILLKSIEGAAGFIMGLLKEIMTSSAKNKAAALLLRKDLYGLKDRMSASKVGGTALLGISKPVVKAHGSSDAEAFFNAVRQASVVAGSGMIEAVTAQLKNKEEA